MNKEFIKKMIKAKRLQCEAIKEIMPETIKNRVDSFEKEAFSLMKDIIIEIVNEDMSKKGNSKTKNHMDSEDDTCNKKIKKVNVNFN